MDNFIRLSFYTIKVKNNFIISPGCVATNGVMLSLFIMLRLLTAICRTIGIEFLQSYIFKFYFHCKTNKGEFNLKMQSNSNLVIFLYSESRTLYNALFKWFVAKVNRNKMTQ